MATLPHYDSMAELQAYHTMARRHMETKMRYGRWTYVKWIVLFTGICLLGEGAALAECPLGDRTVTLQGFLVGINHGGEHEIRTVSSDRCETFTAEVQFDNLSDHLADGAVYLFSENLATIFAGGGSNMAAGQSKSWTFPSEDSEGSSFPLSATPNGKLSTIDLWSYLATSDAPVQYTVTIHFVPRPGYNLVGEAFGTAEPLQNNTVLHLTMRGTPSVYNVVTLKPSGTLTISGSATNMSWYGGIVLGFFADLSTAPGARRHDWSASTDSPPQSVAAADEDAPMAAVRSDDDLT